jgi:hypothetical protein
VSCEVLKLKDLFALCLSVHVDDIFFFFLCL